MQALLINCTLKTGEEASNTEALMRKVEKHLRGLGAEVEMLRLVNLNILPGTETDMGAGDGWKTVLDKIKRADMLVLGTPIWMGQIGSVAQRFMERMDAIFHDEALADPDTGRYFTYGKVAGVVVTGNQDGAQAVSRYVLWAFSEMGFAIPPNAACFWVGDAEGEKSFLDAGGEKSLYANRTSRYVAHNLVAVHKALTATPILTSLKALDEEAKKESAKT